MVAWRFDTARGPAWVPLYTTLDLFDFDEDKVVELANKGDAYYKLDNGVEQARVTNLLPSAYLGPCEAISISQEDMDDTHAPGGA